MQRVEHVHVLIMETIVDEWEVNLNFAVFGKRRRDGRRRDVKEEGDLNEIRQIREEISWGIERRRDILSFSQWSAFEQKFSNFFCH